jgi:hypothetical protein
MKVRTPLIVLVAPFFALACGKPKAMPIQNVSLQVPEYTAAKNFSLSSSQGVRTYFGQMLIWDPEVKKSDVTEVLRLKRAANEASVARVKSLDGYVTNVLAPASREIDGLIANKQRIEANSGARIRELSVGIADVWFEQEIEKNLSSEEQVVVQNARDVFAAYCEAKLISFATSPALASYQFASRPTPLAVCESVYKSKNFFADASCESGAEPKSFFGCLWTHGVLKTRFAQRYGTEQRVTISNLVANPSFQRIFSGNVDSDCSLIKVRGTNRIRTSATAETIANHVLSGAKSQEFSCNGIQASFSLADAPVEASFLDKASPSKIFGDLESRGVNCATMICFVPQSFSGGAVSSVAAQGFGARLSRNLMAFAGQSVACGDSRAAWWTKNFVVFNKPLMSEGAAQQGVCNEAEASDYPAVVATDADLEKAKALAQAAVAEFAKKKMKACLAFDADCDPSSVDNKLSEAERSASTAASSAALRKGVAIAVVPSFSVSTRSDNGIDVVTVSIESTEKRGRWSICLQGGTAVTCAPNVLSESEKLLKSASFDSNTGILSVDVEIDETRLFGHQEFGVHELVKRDFVGSVLHVELLPAKMGDFLPYFSGTVSVMNNGKKIYQGVAFGVDTELSRSHERIYYSH